MSKSLSVIKKRLPGGLRTILFPRTEGQTVTFLVLIGVGSRYETAKQSGLSHFLEHMFFKGTKNRPTTKEIAEDIDNIGGEFNAFTGEEYTGYYVKVAVDNLTHGAEVVADILLNPLFPQEEIDRERGVIIEEIRMYTDMPMRHVQHLWQEALYGPHPLGTRIDGSEESVSKFMRKDFINYTKKHYHTENTVVAVAGNIDVGKTAQLLKKLFTPLSKGSETVPRPAPKKVPHKRFVHEYRKHLDQTHFIVGVPGLSLTDKRRYAADLLAVILGGGMSSRLFLTVRERHGLAYAVRTSSDNYVDTGSFATQAGVRTDKADFALQLIMEEYERVGQESVTAGELKKAKTMLRGHMVRDLEETNSLAMFVAGQELLRRRVLTFDEIWSNIDRVSLDDIQEVAQEILLPEKMTVALLSPHRSVKSFEKQLV